MVFYVCPSQWPHQLRFWDLRMGLSPSLNSSDFPTMEVKGRVCITWVSCQTNEFSGPHGTTCQKFIVVFDDNVSAFKIII